MDGDKLGDADKLSESPDSQSIPPQFVSYPRYGSIPVLVPGSAEQLLALRQGFLWLAWTFLIAVAAMFSLVGWPAELRWLTLGPWISMAVIGALSLVGCAKVAYGMGWSIYLVPVYALVMATSPFCIGLVMFVVLMQLTINRVFQYGVPRRAMGTFRRADVLETARRISLRLPESQ